MVIRRIGCDAAAADYARRALNFPGVRVLARVERETRPRHGAATTETRYFASSLGPERAGPARLLGLVRGLVAGCGRRPVLGRRPCRQAHHGSALMTLLSACRFPGEAGGR